MNEDLPYEQQMMPILKNYDKLVEENRELKSEIKVLEKAVLSTRAMVKRELNVEFSKLVNKYENKERELIGEYENKKKKLISRYENKERKLITEYENKKKTLITNYENRDKNRLRENRKLKDSVEKLEKKITTEKRLMRQELSDEAKFAMNTFKNREKK